MMYRFSNKLCIRGFSTQSTNIGFIGLGNMGSHMASNLIKSGHKLVVLDKSTEAMAKLESLGATRATTPKEVAEQCSTIITMLPSSPHVREVYLNETEGLKAGITKGEKKFFIDSSTIDPGTAKDVANEMSDDTIEMIDAPVSGGVGGAENGTLTFMVGGKETSFNSAKSILENMGKNIVHCGDNGTGQVAKVCNNMLLAISMIGTSEAMSLGVKLGMDPKILAGIINTSSGKCWSSEVYNPCPDVIPTVPSSNNYQGGFAVDLMLKDIGLALQAGKDAKTDIIMGSVAHEFYKKTSEAGHGRKDFSYAYKIFDESTGEK